MIKNKNTTKSKGTNVFGKSKASALVLAGIFVAVYVILNFFSIVVSNFLIIRFSFLAFVAAGYVFEPMMAMQIGFASDILAFIIKPQGFYFIGFTLNAILVCYIYSRFLHNKRITKHRVFVTLAVSVGLISFIFNPLWLYFMYNTNVYSVMRVITAVIKYPIDVFLAYSLLKLLERANFGFNKSKNDSYFRKAVKRLDKLILLTVLCIKGIGNSKVLKAFKGDLKLEAENCLELDIDLFLEKINDFLGLKKAIKKEELEKAILKAKNIVSTCEKEEIKFVGYFDEEYPKLLRKIGKPPIILYYKGKLKQLNEGVNIALIGTRKPSDWSIEVGKKIATRLVSEKITIVSGLASGCDTVGHKIAVENNAPTIAYLPCGLDSVYPLKNRELARKILATGGCLVSEYPPASKALKSHFGERDRLQSGSSNGVIVLESTLKGGTMITASCAVSQKRKLGVLWKRTTELKNNEIKDNKFENPKGNSALVEKGAEQIECMADLNRFIKTCKSYKQLNLLPDYEDKDGLKQLRIFEEQMTYKIKAKKVLEEKSIYGEKENDEW